MEWTQAVIAELRRLWAEGLSTAEIGRRLGVSKNAVVGKAHRLALAPRPSPIHRSAAPAMAPAAPRRALGPTLPPLAQQAVHTPPAPAEPPIARSAPMLRAVAVSLPRNGGRISACCWPIGEPGTSGFHFCGCQAIQGKPYCGDHAQLAYVKVRDRREEAREIA